MIALQVSIRIVVLLRILVSDECFVGLDISARADFISQRFVDERKSVRDQEHPSAHGLAADLDAEPSKISPRDFMAAKFRVCRCLLCPRLISHLKVR